MDMIKQVAEQTHRVRQNAYRMALHGQYQLFKLMRQGLEEFHYSSTQNRPVESRPYKEDNVQPNSASQFDSKEQVHDEEEQNKERPKLEDYPFLNNPEKRVSKGQKEELLDEVDELSDEAIPRDELEESELSYIYPEEKEAQALDDYMSNSHYDEWYDEEDDSDDQSFSA